MKPLPLLSLAGLMGITSAYAEEKFGTLIFEDRFERSESQELKDEPGNEWTTSSDRTAKGNKQIDLRDGAVYIYTHAEANHATSFRHEIDFKDGTVGLRFKLEDESDSLNLNFADLGLKTVHAGHLFKIILGTSSVKIADQKTGEMNLALRNAKKEGTLTAEQKKFVLQKSKTIPHPISTDQWHQVYVTIEGNKISCTVDDQPVGNFQSEGFAHETKKLLRLLVAKNAFIDDVKIWRLR